MGDKKIVTGSSRRSGVKLLDDEAITAMLEEAEELESKRSTDEDEETEDDVDPAGD